MTSLMERPPRALPEGRVSVGDVVDLTIRFGAQVRVKCAYCTCYMPRINGDSEVSCNHCGTHYERHDALHKVVRIP